jgi:hypothetical protein
LYPSLENSRTRITIIIGHTEQLLMLKSEVDKYLIGSGNLRDHVSRLNVNPSVSSDGSGSSENSRSVGKSHC